MKCQILKESRGRIRVHLCRNHMTLAQADLLEYYLKSVSGVRSVQVFDRTGDAIVVYTGERSDIIRAFSSFSYEKAEALDLVPEHTPRALNREFEDKLVGSVMNRAFTKLFLPLPVRSVLAVWKAVPYVSSAVDLSFSDSSIIFTMRSYRPPPLTFSTAITQSPSSTTVPA
jgi:hypothetical protein